MRIIPSMRLPWPCAVFIAAALASCGRASPSPADRAQPPDAHVKELADAYVAAFLERNPDLYTYFGIPGGRHDRLADNSRAAQRAWEAKEDAWLKDVGAIDAGTIEDRSLRAT